MTIETESEQRQKLLQQLGLEPATSGTLMEQWELKVLEAETRNLQAITESELAKSEFLQTQMGMSDPATLELSQLMPMEGLDSTMDYTTLLIIGVVVWYIYKGGKS